jgi:hypothetical protein
MWRLKKTILFRIFAAMKIDSREDGRGEIK